MVSLRWPTVVLGLAAFYLLYYFVGPEGHKLSRVAFEESIPRLDAILDGWKQALGDSHLGYRNHCYRVYHFTKALAAEAQHPLTPVELEQVAIAVAHHDLGIWSDKLNDGRPNIDYIDPSVQRAVEWMKKNNKPTEWIEPISLMISEHHKLRSYTHHSASASNSDVERLVETFRQADLVDFSLGLVRNGLSRALVSSVRDHWPNAGFHAGLVTILVDRFRTHPLNPFPMMKF